MIPMTATFPPGLITVPGGFFEKRLAPMPTGELVNQWRIRRGGPFRGERLLPRR
jgi:hypothetical protein